MENKLKIREFLFTSQMHTVLGKEKEMKMVIVCQESFILKKDLEKISTKELKKVLNLINSRPRKYLNYVTSGKNFI